jgi:tetratricopeptide (TPR) repeat protein
MRRAFSARDVAQIVGISESRVRYWAQTGVVGPSGRGHGYSFQDLVGVKAAKELLDGGVTLQRARKNLEALRTQLGAELPLSRMRVRSDGEQLLVSDGGAPFEPLTGQLVMDFALDELEGKLRDFAVAAPPPSSAGVDGAWNWFIEAGRLEAAGDDEGALTAYAKALDGDPALAAAHTNLGNLRYRRGERGQAREYYERALALDPEQPEARFNLGNLLDDVGDGDGARMEWLRVVATCPEFADAHWNLAVACTRAGDVEMARLHLRRYQALVPDDGRARELLERL